MPCLKDNCAKPPASLVPLPPSIGALDRTYVHNSLRKIRYIDILISKIVETSSSAEGRSDFLYFDKLLAVSHTINTHQRNYTDACLAFECRALCDAVYGTLPAELREMIWGYVFSDSHVYVTMKQLDVIPKNCTEPQFSPKFLKSYVQSNSHGRETAVYGHVFNSSYVEEAVRRELINTWYRVMTFNFDNGSDYLPAKHPDYISQVMHLFKHDRWGMGFDLRELIKSVQITYLTSARGTFREFPLKIYYPLLQLPQSAPLLDPALKLMPSTKITLYVENVCCDCRDKSCLDLNTEMRRAFVLIGQIKLLLEHGLTVWVDLVHRLKFKAKMEELNEECWAEKAAAVQARSVVSFCCLQSWKE